MLKRIWRSDRFRRFMGYVLATYLRLVGHTTRFVVEPANALDTAEAASPIIAAMWHGQHFMIPFARRKTMRFAVLVSRHGDGEINAIAARLLGIALIRGSGAQRKDQIQKRGGVVALRGMLDAMDAGSSLCLTADIPKISRIAGPGIITLARLSGRPIYPVAVVKRFRIDFRSWDSASIGLPFGRGAIVLGDPILVAKDATDAELETARLAVETGLDQVHARAYALVGSTDPGAVRPDIARARLQAQKRVNGTTEGSL